MRPERSDTPELANGGREALAEYRALLKSVREAYHDAGRHMELGRFYLKLGHKARAYSAFRAAKALEPRLTEAYTALGRLYTEDGDLESARQSYLQLLAFAPELASIHLELGRVYRGLGDLPRAVTALGTAVRLEPDLVDAYRILAEIALEQDELDRALSYLNHLKALSPQDAEVFRLAAAAQAKRGARDRAILELKQALVLDPSNAAARHDLARHWLAEGLAKPALEALGPRLAPEIEDAEAQVLAVRAAMAMNELTEAEAMAVRLMRAFPGDARGPLFRARLAAERQDLAEAGPLYRRAADLTPGDPGPLLELAEFRTRAGDTAGARALYRELGQVHGKDARIRVLEARLEAAGGDLAAARARYDEALALDADNPATLRERARVLLREGAYDAALADLDRARELDPDGGGTDQDMALLREHESYREAFRLHGEASEALRRGDYPAARGHLKAIVGLFPDNPRWLAELADAARVMGDGPEALTRLSELLAKTPEDRSAQRTRADLCYRTERFDEAGKAYEQLVGTDPEDVGARLRVLRVLRHRLVARTLPKDAFSALEVAYREQLEAPARKDLAHLELAYLHMGMGSHLFEPKIWVSAAETHLGSIGASAPVEVSARLPLARLELARLRGEPEAVEAATDDWVRRAPGLADAAHAQLLILEARGKPRAGRMRAAEHAKNFPDDGRIVRAWMRFLRAEAEGQPELVAGLAERIRVLQREAADEPTRAERFLRLGFAQLYLSPPERASEAQGLASAAFKKAADLDPTSPWPWWGAVLAAAESALAPRASHAALERALAAARAACRRFPKSPWLLYEAARLALADRDPVVQAEGRRTLERCLLQGERPFAPAHARMGQLCEAGGDQLGAFHHYLQVFEEPEGLGEDAPVLARLRKLGTP